MKGRERPQETPDLPKPWSWTPSSRTMRKYISVVQATQALAACYGSPSKLIQCQNPLRKLPVTKDVSEITVNSRVDFIFLWKSISNYSDHIFLQLTFSTARKHLLVLLQNLKPSSISQLEGIFFNHLTLTPCFTEGKRHLGVTQLGISVKLSPGGSLSAFAPGALWRKLR